MSRCHAVYLVVRGRLRALSGDVPGVMLQALLGDVRLAVFAAMYR